jgi:hypothetical protein
MGPQLIKKVGSVIVAVRRASGDLGGTVLICAMKSGIGWSGNNRPVVSRAVLSTGKALRTLSLSAIAALCAATILAMTSSIRVRADEGGVNTSFGRTHPGAHTIELIGHMGWEGTLPVKTFGFSMDGDWPLFGSFVGTISISPFCGVNDGDYYETKRGLLTLAWDDPRTTKRRLVAGKDPFGVIFPSRPQQHLSAVRVQFDKGNAFQTSDLWLKTELDIRIPPGATRVVSVEIDYPSAISPRRQ